MTEDPQHIDAAVVLSVTEVWKSYFDQQSASFASALRPWQISPGPSRLWEPYREAAALNIATLLTAIARGPFARLYQSSLIEQAPL